MKRKYNRPTFKVKNLRTNRLLTSNSKVYDVPVGGKGGFDAKACFLNDDEEDFEIE